jgi:hypothetical protein
MDKILLIFLVLVIFLLGCGETELTGCEGHKGDMCYTLYDPVCGLTKDGWKTFSNDCVACTSGATSYKEGECK